MTAIIILAAFLALLAVTVRIIAATPLLRTLGVTIDCWADAVQGDVERLR
jgi:hypothetical protein